MLPNVLKLAPLIAMLCFSCNPPAGGGGATAEANKKNDAGTAPAGCLAIVGGTESEAQPAIGMLYQRKGDQIFICTGTFVSQNTLITAAHCFPFGRDIYYSPGSSWDLTNEEVVNQVTRDAVPSTKVVLSPVKIHNGSGIASTDSHMDLAVVIFPDNTAPATLPILGRPAVEGEPAELFGYGRTEIDGKHADAQSGTMTAKRHGRNKVSKPEQLLKSYPNTLMLFGAASGTGQDKALASNGDSGGPLLVDGAVVGIASTASLSKSLGDVTKEEAFTVYADLSSTYARDFYREAEQAGATFSYSQDVIGGKHDVRPSAEKACD